MGLLLRLDVQETIVSNAYMHCVLVTCWEIFAVQWNCFLACVCVCVRARICLYVSQLPKWLFPHFTHVLYFLALAPKRWVHSGKLTWQWKIHHLDGIYQEKWVYSIAMLIYQRVLLRWFFQCCFAWILPVLFDTSHFLLALQHWTLKVHDTTTRCHEIYTTGFLSDALLPMVNQHLDHG